MASMSSWSLALPITWLASCFIASCILMARDLKLLSQQTGWLWSLNRCSKFTRKAAHQLASATSRPACWQIPRNHQDFPCLQAKDFGPAFLPVLQSLLDTSKEEHSKIVEALECLANLLSVFDAADMVLTEMEFHQATDLAKRLFLCLWLVA